ncbi:MAG: hypothetical protein EOO39_20465, partial [Cytophagaceae bacterium]
MKSPVSGNKAALTTGRQPIWYRPVAAFLPVWERTINIGIQEGLSSWDRKRVRLLNGITAFALIIFPLYLISFINSPDYITFRMCGVIFCLHAVVLVLTYFRRYNAAVWYFLLMGPLFYSFNSIAKKHDGTEYTIILYGIMGMMFLRNYWVIGLYFLLNVAAFFLVRYAITVVPPFLYIPEMTDLYNQNTLTVILSLFAVVYYFKSENQQQEVLLERKNEQLQASLVDLHAAQAQLVQREKLASLGELTAGVAHEIQNPLNFVNNFAELSGELVSELIDEHDKAAERDPGLETELLADLQQNIAKISRHGKRAAAIVHGMLEHSRASTGDRELIDLNTLCAEYLQLSYGALKTEAHLPPPGYRTELDPALMPLNVVPQDIGRVLLNLINNAFYAVLQRQRDEPGTFQPEIWVKTQQLDDHVEIQVGDNGTGIDSPIQAKIFQP